MPTLVVLVHVNRNELFHGYHSKFFSFFKALVNTPGDMLLLTPKHEQAPPDMMDPRINRPPSSYFVQIIQVYSCLVVDV